MSTILVEKEMFAEPEAKKLRNELKKGKDSLRLTRLIFLFLAILQVQNQSDAYERELGQSTNICKGSK